MNIGLIGYGKMGKMVEAAALNCGHGITFAVDPFAPGGQTAGGAPLLRAFPSIKEKIDSTGVFIEFTRPETAPDNIKAACALGKPVVCGSTGWYAHLPDVSAAVEKAGAALLWSSNFSLGVNLFYRIAEYAAKLADPFAEYDVGGLEIHHNKKADSPSGTAKTLMERALAVMKRKTRVLWGDPSLPDGDATGGTLPPDTVHFASLRQGSAPGTHSLFFDSPADTIEITHTARSREGFASGAVRAAEWLVSVPRQGIFTMEDVLK
ncbi:MAG: 4-hydroxy-tetrahydrodipicolinate reductase [Spirochaetaceae bacterium]|jgi:4-hydroxy-tetrahydrodipicolinate reductase|nr:4-hydroxy-tetrahydrodipicolinate reductase [Spirochaetaceae bacterium]